MERDESRDDSVHSDRREARQIFASRIVSLDYREGGTMTAVLTTKANGKRLAPGYEPTPDDLRDSRDDGAPADPDTGFVRRPDAEAYAEQVYAEMGGDGKGLLPELVIETTLNLCAKFPEMLPEVIAGLLRTGETGNLISASKRGKTHLAIYIALCICTGRRIFDRFRVSKPGLVLYIDAELHKNTLAKRILTVAQAMGLAPEDYADKLHVVSLRGSRTDINSLGKLFSIIERGTYAAVFLDALYRLIPGGVDENSNSEMTLIFNTIDKYAEQLGAAIIVVHHSSKGAQGHKSVTDVGAGAGAMSRATDTHIVLRDHEEPDAVVLEAACRSFRAPEPMVLGWDFPLWVHRPDLDPNDLKQPGKRRRAVKGEEPEAEEKAPAFTPETFAAAFIGAEPEAKDAILFRAAEHPNLSSRAAEKLLRVAEAKKLAHRWIVPKDRTVYVANRPQQGAEIA